MNPHIELVKKFLADNDSVTEEELRVNKADARSAYWANEIEVAEAAAFSAFRAALWAYFAAEYGNPEDAEYYKQQAKEAVAKYEELTK